MFFFRGFSENRLNFAGTILYYYTVCLCFGGVFAKAEAGQNTILRKKRTCTKQPRHISGRRSTALTPGFFVLRFRPPQPTTSTPIWVSPRPFRLFLFRETHINRRFQHKLNLRFFVFGRPRCGTQIPIPTTMLRHGKISVRTWLLLRKHLTAAGDLPTCAPPD